jgi:hypothetical protein
LTKKQREALSRKERAGRQKNKLDSWVKFHEGASGNVEGTTFANPKDENGEDNTSAKASNGKRKAETIIVDDVVEVTSPFMSSSHTGQKRSRKDVGNDVDDDDKVLVVQEKGLVECPICDAQVAESHINEHLDVVHP